MRDAGWKLSLVALILLTVGALHPWREMPLEDDWAYARTAEFLLQHGGYQLHPWISANMPFQAAWGALFTLILGPGFAALRISTLLLSFSGLFACYQLLKNDGRPESEACLAVAVLWFSPLILRFSLNFMTDVPFTALVFLSLWLYTRAWKGESYWWMAAGALAGTAAILTRQFAIALIPALLVAGWMRRSASKTIGLTMLAVMPLILAGAYQIVSVILHPTWAQQINLRAQHQLMGNWREWGAELLWRPGVLLQYLCLFTLPLSLGAVVQLAGHRPRTRVFVWLCAGAAAVSGLSLLIGAETHRAMILPRIPWNLEGLEWFGTPLRSLTIVTLIAVVPLTALLAMTVWRDFQERSGALLIHTTMICLLPLTLVYHQFGDEYLLVYVPWTIWTLARSIEWRKPALWCAATVLALQVAVVVPWEDYILAYTDAQWQAATLTVDRFHLRPTQVYAGWTWDCYYAFDEYMAEFPAAGQVNFDTLFVKWLPKMEKQADYRVKTGYLGELSDRAEVVVRRRTLTGRTIESRVVRSP